MARLDKNNDGILTKQEFIDGGKDGLPTFPEYGEHALGHHYDEESEFFMHHEEIYHNTPDTQKASAYIHDEDKEHFAHHDAIEAEEERRERHAEGMPTREEDLKLAEEASKKGEKYISPYEAQIPKPGSPAPVHEQWNAHAGGHAANEAAAGVQHVFKGPGGSHVVKTNQEQAINAEQAALEHDLNPDRMDGETDQGYTMRLAAAKQAYEAKKAEEGVAMKMKKEADETDEAFAKRVAKAKFIAAKSRPGMAPPSTAGRGKAPNKVSGRLEGDVDLSHMTDSDHLIRFSPYSIRPLAEARREREASLASSRRDKRRVLSCTRSTMSLPRSKETSLASMKLVYRDELQDIRCDLTLLL